MSQNNFPIFQNHLDLAHNYLLKVLTPGDIAIDATCGNGHDTLFLAKCCLSEEAGELYSFDIQETALRIAQKRVQAELPKSFLDKIHFIEACHSQFPESFFTKKIKAIVYNLGYLPGGDKSKTTMLETTLLSLQNATTLLSDKGVILITCYPGHEEGKKEEQKLLEFVSQLPATSWNCCYHQWLNRKNSPSLILLQKCNAH